MTNPCQDPTPAQEALHELHGEILRLKEQIVEAHNIIVWIPKLDAPIGLIGEAEDWLTQNESIVKEQSN